MAAGDEWEIEYYETATGRKPVLNWIEDMRPTAKARALQYIDQLQLLGLEAREPLVKPLGDKLYELRWKAEDKQHRIAYFAAAGRTFVLLHGFIKKAQATPQQDIDTAKERMEDYLRRHRA